MALDVRVEIASELEWVAQSLLRKAEKLADDENDNTSPGLFVAAKLLKRRAATFRRGKR
jgi:hypothetical protein